jgi:hypothetical protein
MRGSEESVAVEGGGVLICVGVGVAEGSGNSRLQAKSINAIINIVQRRRLIAGLHWNEPSIQKGKHLENVSFLLVIQSNLHRRMIFIS